MGMILTVSGVQSIDKLGANGICGSLRSLAPSVRGELVEPPRHQSPTNPQRGLVTLPLNVHHGVPAAPSDSEDCPHCNREALRRFVRG